MDDKRVEKEVRSVWRKREKERLEEEGERAIGEGEGTTTTQISLGVYLNRQLQAQPWTTMLSPSSAAFVFGGLCSLLVSLSLSLCLSLGSRKCRKII